jgi:hypothetical protein
VTVTRRAFVRSAGGVLITAAGLPVLAACSLATPAAPAANSSSGSGGGAKVVLPTYVPLPNLPAADPAGALYYAGKWIFSPHAGWSLVAYQTAWERANADPTAKPRSARPARSC